MPNQFGRTLDVLIWNEFVRFYSKLHALHQAIVDDDH